MRRGQQRERNREEFHGGAKYFAPRLCGSIECRREGDRAQEHDQADRGYLRFLCIGD
jgi:hypothetical protein